MQIKRNLLILILLIFAYRFSKAQDTLLEKKTGDIKKFEFGLTTSTFFAPALYSEDIIMNKRSMLSWGINYFMNYHFTRHIGINSGVGFSMWKNSFDYIFLDGENIPPNYDTSVFSVKSTCLKLPVNFLWDVNPKKKVQCFINAGISPSAINSGLQFNGGSRNWLQPARSSWTKFYLLYNFNFGLRVPLYKQFSYIFNISFESSAMQIKSTYLRNFIYTKRVFLLINMGFSL